MLKIPSTQANAILVKARRVLADHRERAKKDGVLIDYGLLNVQYLLEHNPLCHYCAKPVAFDLQIDHKKPISRGGAHSLANLCVACARCNSIKGSLTEGEFLGLLKWLGELTYVARADVERRLLAGGKRYAGNKKKKAV